MTIANSTTTFFLTFKRFDNIQVMEGHVKSKRGVVPLTKVGSRMLTSTILLFNIKKPSFVLKNQEMKDLNRALNKICNNL